MGWLSKYDDGGKKKKFLQPNDEHLPSGRVHPFYYEPSSELATSIGGENGKPAYLIPTFKYGHPLEDPLKEFHETGEYLGGPFKTWQEADEWDRTIRHPYVEKNQSLPFPLRTKGKEYQNGGFLGTTNRGRNYSPAWNGQFQDGGEMSYYQQGRDFQPKMISQNGSRVLSTPSSFTEYAKHYNQQEDQKQNPQNYFGLRDPNFIPQPGTAEYVPIEMMTLPATPTIQGIGKLANMAIDAMNPASGIRTARRVLNLPISDAEDLVKYSKIGQKVSDIPRSLKEIKEIKAIQKRMKTKSLNDLIDMKKSRMLEGSIPNYEETFNDIEKNIQEAIHNRELSFERPLGNNKINDMYEIEDLHMPTSKQYKKRVLNPKIKVGDNLMESWSSSDHSDIQVGLEHQNPELSTPFNIGTVRNHELDHYISYPTTEDYSAYKDIFDLRNSNDYYIGKGYGDIAGRRGAEIKARLGQIKDLLGIAGNTPITKEQLRAGLHVINNPEKFKLIGNTKDSNPLSYKGLLDSDIEFFRRVKDRKKLLKYMNEAPTNSVLTAHKLGGEIKKDNLGYWNSENWGHPVEINSPNITMKNVPFDIEAISNAGEHKILKANSAGHKFKGTKVREYPIAQTGEEIKGFYNEYLHSPNYKKRLQKQGYSNPENVINKRLKNLELSRIRSTDEGSYYNQSNHTAYVDPKDSHEFNTSQDVIAAHELSHGVGAIASKMKPEYSGLNPLENAKINNRNNLSNYANDYVSGKVPLDVNKIHDSSPHEYKADMDAFRYQLKKDNLYDTGTQEFNQKILDVAKKKYKGNKEFERLFKRSKDNELIELMNTIAQNKQSSSMEYPIAKYGINELNELTNFANSPTKNWLQKYK